MSRRGPFDRLRAGLLLGALALACGEDESLTEVRPVILVCAEEKLDSTLCDRPFELGELPMDAPREVTVFVQNRGEVALEVSGVRGRTPNVSATEASFLVPVRSAKPLHVSVTSLELGAGQVVLEVVSDDPRRRTSEVVLTFIGGPKPTPKIELCTEDGPCGPEISLDLGVVRRAQEESRTVLVRNAGTARLDIAAVRLEGSASNASELEIATSTRRGFLDPGGEAPLVIVYRPLDGLSDSVDLVFESNDPEHPEARAHVSAGSSDNFPPVADARYAATSSTSVVVAVGDRVFLDGRLSIDPEHDPLVFDWRLNAPAGSSATIDDPTGAVASFLPDRAGTYSVELDVIDSLLQRSEVQAVVLVEARPRFGFRALLEWAGSADLDLHLVPGSDVLFGPTDTHFAVPNPNLGDPSAPDDDPVLLEDATDAPGPEEIAIVAPAAGSYRLYVHDYEDQARVPANATVTVILEDASIPVFSATRSLPAACAIWYVGSVTFPGGVFQQGGTDPPSECR
ncbi:MAG: hypothetical protein HYV07_25190 [Deltaproteobacteria bacterium]|nr:hypothetical protein [Deltaproteobacteria bacterium]